MVAAGSNLNDQERSLPLNDQERSLSDPSLSHGSTEAWKHRTTHPQRTPIPTRPPAHPPPPRAAGARGDDRSDGGAAGAGGGAHRVVGVIDFGDLVHSWVVNDVAIAMAYSMLTPLGHRDGDYVGAASATLRGWASAPFALTAVCSSGLWPLAVLRRARPSRRGGCDPLAHYAMSRHPSQVELRRRLGGFCIPFLDSTMNVALNIAIRCSLRRSSCAASACSSRAASPSP